MTVNSPVKKRISSIDILRGFVMLLMLVDHVRERFFLHMQVSDPLTIETTSSGLFFTRLSAHLCAPIFVFLTGLSAWLYANPNNKPKRSPSGFLFKRGLFLILIELTLVNFSWFGNYNNLYLQVIWAIGLSMICLSVLVKLPIRLILVIGLLIIFGHNLLTPISFENTDAGYIPWTILHDRGYLFTSDWFNIKISYPVLPWIGVIALGYSLGSLYSSKTSSKIRLKSLTILGASCLFLLLILREFNIYGETLPWINYSNSIDSLKSFLNYTKYPPSLDFLLFGLGIGFLLLIVFEKFENKLTNAIKVLGSAPMFFYILHLYVLLLIYTVFVNLFGENKGDYFGFDHLYQIWIFSILLSIVLYFPTKIFARYKRKSKSKLIKYF
ncbi:DUF1624 domain-containing protein [Mesoflavibacter sp.]|uniref:DUF1624 domain-containing protein n=1 Tax=Mesoflavibacter sp. TaxID=1930902 RepID=UPI003518D156